MDYGSGVWVGVDFSFRWLLELSGKISWESTLRHCINIGTEAPPPKKEKKERKTNKQTNKPTNKKPNKQTKKHNSHFPLCLPSFYLISHNQDLLVSRLFSLCYKNGKYKTGGGLKVWEWVGQINRRNQAGLTCSTTSSWPPLSPSLVAAGVHPHSLDGDWTCGQIEHVVRLITAIPTLSIYIHVHVPKSVYRHGHSCGGCMLW